jgi:hypothetical protein
MQADNGVSWIIPVEVTVVQGNFSLNFLNGNLDGVHLTPEELDFGTITSASENRTRFLSVLNSNRYPIRITDLKVAPTTMDSQLFINFTSTIVPPGSVSLIVVLFLIQ